MFRTLVVQININFFNDIPEPPVQTSGGSLDFGIHCGLARHVEIWRTRTARKILATASPIWTLGKNTGRVGVAHYPGQLWRKEGAAVIKCVAVAINWGVGNAYRWLPTHTSFNIYNENNYCEEKIHTNNQKTDLKVAIYSYPPIQWNIMLFKKLMTTFWIGNE